MPGCPLSRVTCWTSKHHIHSCRLGSRDSVCCGNYVIGHEGVSLRPSEKQKPVRLD